MRKSRLSLAIICLTLIFGFAVHANADWTKISSKEFKLAGPPNQAQSQIEAEELIKLQMSRAESECKLGQKQASPDFPSLFADSPLLTKLEIKAISPFMSRVSHFGERVANYFKGKYRRARPYDFDPRVQPCVALPGGAKSYPSSHAAVSALDACVLGLIFPSYSRDFDDLGRTLGERRMVIGVHFPSDVEAGQSLAADICRRLVQENDFRVELKELQDSL
jgi:acid phosphatase (class A)